MSSVVTLIAPDISCGHCEATVRKTVGALPGVADVEVSAATKIIKITLDSDATSTETIQSVLDDAGYPATVQ